MRKIVTVLFVFIFCVIVAESVMAVGIGFYGEYSRGLEGYGGNLGGDLRGSDNYNGGSGGLIIDSAAAKDTLFNYRLRLGAGKITFTSDPFTAVSMLHTFGISPANLRGDTVRFWFGPRVGLHYLFTKITEKVNQDMLMMMYLYGPIASPLLFINQSNERRIDMFKIDVGLVFAGFNFNFGDAFTLSLELGFNYGYRIGQIDNYTNKKGNVYGDGIEGFGTISIMFRINDKYSHADNTGTGEKLINK